MLLLNAFSFNMVPAFAGTIKFTELSAYEAARQISDSGNGLQSAVGHADTAAVFASQLGREVPCARTNVTLHAGDRAIVGQYSGARLPEGATLLPDGASIRWLLIEVA